MSRFLVLNFQDFGLEHNISETIQSQSLFCICCLRKDGQFYKLSSCTHKEYLDVFDQLKTKLQLSIKEVVCAHCHGMLKRIELFRQQVQESYKILEEASNTSEIKTVNRINFQIKKTVDLDIEPFTPQILQNQKCPQTNAIKAKIITKSNCKTKINSKTKSNNKRIACEEEEISASILSTKDVQDPLQIKEPFIEVEVSAKQLSSPSDASADAKSSDDENLADPIKTQENFQEVPIKMEVKLEPLEADNEYPKEITVTNIEPSSQGKNRTPMAQKPKSQITTVTLTKEELAQERLDVAQSEEYLKQPFKCKYCLIGFNYEDNLKDHMTRRHAPKAGSVTCEICLQVLYPPGSITAHNYRHYSRWQCCECSARFPHYDSALQHCRGAHGKAKQKRVWRCRHCDFTTENQKQLTSHKLKHEQFPCKDCGLVMSSMASYRRHLFYIHKKTPRKCSPCDRQFESVAAYEAHMRGHGGRDARCGPCGVSFSSWHAYNAHWLHSAAHAKDTNKYKCGDCSASFATAAYLRSHARGRHQRAQAHHCPHCSRSFVLAVEMKLHVRKVHCERAVRICDYCQKSYKNRVHLRRHIEEAHSDKLKRTAEAAPSEKVKKKPKLNSC